MAGIQPRRFGSVGHLDYKVVASAYGNPSTYVVAEVDEFFDFAEDSRIALAVRGVQCYTFRSQRQHDRFAGAFCIHRERGNGFTRFEFDRTGIAILLDHSADEFVVLADELGDERVVRSFV